jgi:hypothetical protein
LYFTGYNWSEGNTVENVHCLRCNRQLESGRKFVAIYMFAQTVGIKPRQKSAAQRIVFCPQCSVSLALGLSPEGALNIAAWDMIRDLVSSDPALNQAAWENLRGALIGGRRSRTGAPSGARAGAEATRGCIGELQPSRLAAVMLRIRASL